MKKIFIYILLVLSIGFVGCAESTSPSDDTNIEYAVVYNSDGYDLEAFDLSDIKIKVTNNSDVSYVPVTSEMLARPYVFDEAGEYLVIIKYNGYSETIKIKLIASQSGDNNGDNNNNTGNSDNNSESQGNGSVDNNNNNNTGNGDNNPKPRGNGYKEITDLYNAYSGSALADRVALESIGTTLYVGNTFGLLKDATYTSSDPSVIKINDNNVLICLKKGRVNISINGEDKVRITVEEATLTADTYYSTIGYLPEMSANDIKTILHNLIDEHVGGSYGLLKTILPLSDADPNNPDNMILLYTGRSQGGEIDHDGDNDGWNREHVWPLSKLGGDTSLTAGHDAHHIRPADLSVNKVRGNLEFGVATTEVQDTYAEGSTHCKISSYYFEPRDEVKGDIARMLFYMAVRYEGDVSGEADLELVFDALSTSTFEFGNLAVLLEWNRLDPVDDFEINRNNVIYTYQKNRNPFIDYPSLADLIWGEQE